LSITVNAALLQSQFNDSDITDTNAEVVIDGAISLLNSFDAGLSNLSGAAGSKTGSYTSKQTGAIMTLAQQIYSKHFKNASGANTGLSGLSLSYRDLDLLSTAKVLAGQLVGRGFKRA
jgi:hypothetical protein